jgi:hypothetical protein
MATVVFSYSHADEALRDELEKHLMPLHRSGLIETWHDRRIVPGQPFENEIDKHFKTADVILLLVSADFIASDYCFNTEMSIALERHEKGEAIVLPVILRSCAWHGLPFGHLLAATKDGRPVTKFSSIDDGFVEVVNAVSRSLKHFNRSTETKLASEDPSSQQNHTSDSPRTSNLAIKRSFTDHDKDQFLQDGFEYLSNFFENSLSELSQRHDQIETRYKKIDANTFEATIYEGGKKIAGCGIWIDSGDRGLGDIKYSQGSYGGSSWNDSMSVVDDSYTLGFKPMMAAFHGGGIQRDGQMTFEGMSEYFWDLLIAPLKPN